jgi:membrane protease YdiL (CAAX protease family)
MVAISILGDGSGIVTGAITGITGRENFAVALALGYAVTATVVAIGVYQFLGDRGIQLSDTWTWRQSSTDATPDDSALNHDMHPFLVGALGGAALALVGSGWVWLLQQYAFDADAVRLSTERMAAIPHLRPAFAVMAVGIAPFAEEYLFRGLLFKTMYREWGNWRATLGSAAFFAALHPPTAWLPVALVGVANAQLFKRTGRLAPAVVLHMVYNAVIVGISFV